MDLDVIDLMADKNNKEIKTQYSKSALTTNLKVLKDTTGQAITILRDINYLANNAKELEKLDIETFRLDDNFKHLCRITEELFRDLSHFFELSAKNIDSSNNIRINVDLLGSQVSGLNELMKAIKEENEGVE